MKSFASRFLMFFVYLCLFTVLSWGQNNSKPSCPCYNDKKQQIGEIICEGKQLPGCWLEDGLVKGNCTTVIGFTENKLASHLLSIVTASSVSLDDNYYSVAKRLEYRTILEEVLTNKTEDEIHYITLQKRTSTFRLPKAVTDELSASVASLSKQKPFKGGATDVLNIALRSQYDSINIYQIGSRFLSGDVLELAKSFLARHQSNKDALIATIRKLGGKPIDEPKFDLDKILAKTTVKELKDAYSVLNLAAQLEGQSVDAYLGVIPKLEKLEIAQAAAKIAADEATHIAILESALKTYRGESFLIGGLSLSPVDLKSILAWKNTQRQTHSK